MLKEMLRLMGRCGPLGSEEDSELQERRLLSSAGGHALDLLIGLVLQPPQPAELAGKSSSDFEYEVSHYLQLLGAQDPNRVLERLAPHLENPVARPVAIEVIGTLRTPQALSTLAPLVGTRNLTE